MQTIHGQKANIKKGDWYKTLDISAGAPSVQMMLHKPAHALRRRVLAQAFSEKAHSDAEPLIAVHAKKLAANLAEYDGEAKPGTWSKTTNMGNWGTWFGFDFVSDLGYGRAFGMLDPTSQHRWVPPVLASASQFLYYVGYLPFIDLVRPLMGTAAQDYVGGQAAQDSLKYTELANGHLAERMKLEEKRKVTGEKAVRNDTFHYLLQAKDPETGRTFTTEELQADSALIIAAGSDGVGITVSATIFHLLHNKKALQKVTKEIRDAFRTADDIRNPRLGDLKYFNACIDETMRMNPPKASALPRQVLEGTSASLFNVKAFSTTISQWLA